MRLPRPSCAGPALHWIGDGMRTMRDPVSDTQASDGTIPKRASTGPMVERMRPHRRSWALFAAAMSALFTTDAAPADSTSSTVTAQVLGVCKFDSGQAPVVTIANSGATIDPSRPGPATGQAAVLYRCTSGTTPAFTVPSPVTVTCKTAGTCGATTMAPTLSSNNTGAGTGFASGNDKTLTVTGQLTAAQYQNMQAGTYSGTVTVTVTP